ncbi:hypothetical protein [Micromonospora echinofusca]|nr:hypothetical protein [Micromonospora echinofusca]
MPTRFGTSSRRTGNISCSAALAGPGVPIVEPGVEDVVARLHGGR